MTVELKPGESQESLLKRFRKRVSESGVLSQVRKRRWHVSKSEERRRAKAKGDQKGQAQGTPEKTTTITSSPKLQEFLVRLPR